MYVSSLFPAVSSSRDFGTLHIYHHSTQQAHVISHDGGRSLAVAQRSFVPFAFEADWGGRCSAQSYSALFRYERAREGLWFLFCLFLYLCARCFCLYQVRVEPYRRSAPMYRTMRSLKRFVEANKSKINPVVKASRRPTKKTAYKREPSYHTFPHQSQAASIGVHNFSGNDTLSIHVRMYE